MKLGIYLFAKILNESDIESEIFKNFINKIKESEINFLEELKEKIEANENDRDIVSFLIKKLEELFAKILIQNI
ncbi:hypothetical protein ACE939_11085 [Aquimarina sp. W85]|uniref:hypothetical protein n=1 Tax=Aquimarina rhodophyticola TaxID=3342246 RepID=UPI0036718096